MHERFLGNVYFAGFFLGKILREDVGIRKGTVRNRRDEVYGDVSRDVLLNTVRYLPDVREPITCIFHFLENNFEEVVDDSGRRARNQHVSSFAQRFRHFAQELADHVGWLRVRES